MTNFSRRAFLAAFACAPLAPRPALATPAVTEQIIASAEKAMWKLVKARDLRAMTFVLKYRTRPTFNQDVRRAS